jgi:GT2 family glycosyltransferase
MSVRNPFNPSDVISKSRGNGGMYNIGADAIIPFHGRVDVLITCLKSLAKGCAPVDSILLVDDGSTADQTRLAKRECSELRLPLRWLTLPRRCGFVRAVNAGWMATKERTTIVLNSDTIPTAAHLHELRHALSEGDELAAVAPTSTNPTDLFQYRVSASTRRGVTFAPYLTAMCLAIRREAIRGSLFDDVYSPGYFEDLDLCCRLRTSGWKLGIAESVVVPHVGRATFGADPHLWELLSRNYATFTRRWGKLPEHVQLEQLLLRVGTSAVPT